MTLLIGGLLLGMKHATEADHLAAVATLATRTRSPQRMLMLGVMWGVGHSLVLLLVGGIVLMLGNVISQQLAQTLEFGAGAMLFLLGCNVVRRCVRESFIRNKLSDHLSWTALRAVRLQPHAHLHAHAHAQHTPAQHQLASGFPMGALGVGMMQGMSGSSAMIVLSMGTVPSVGLGVLYILVFGLGAILGMAALTLAIVVPARYCTSVIAPLQGRLTLLVGAIGVGLGAIIMLENSAAWTA
ncbi:MAG: urease accessory protein [Massilia sp.]|nr:urease accessory protein [Massilia sp.]